MTYKFISTDFYQARSDEIFAVVTLQNEDTPEEYRFISGIEKISYSVESLFDEAINGFTGYRTIDLLYHGKSLCDYLGLDYEDGYTDIFDMIDETQNPRIASINSDRTAWFYFSKMTPAVRKLFEELFQTAQNENFEIHQK